MRSWTPPALPVLPADPAGPRRVRLRDSVTGRLTPTGRIDEPATLYVCGITPYDATHLGHASTYLAFDVLVRAWRDAGRTVTYVQNVTDVDDPLLERAEATGVDWRELAVEQTDLFRSDMTALRVLPPDVYAGAVESMDLVVGGAGELVERGAAYRVEQADDGGEGAGDVYADLAADPRFAAGPHLADVDLESVFAENGGDPGRAGKRHPLDALLWRRARPGEPEWDGGELGAGRPGWHIECACIARRHLGDRIEVQGGGRDLVFPHHEMSESHLRMLTGIEAPVSLHAHVGMVAYEGTKMSKSLGNLVLVSRLVAAGTDPAAVRLAVHAHHYRSDWEYTDADLEGAGRRLERWRRAVLAVDPVDDARSNGGAADGGAAGEADGGDAMTLLGRVRDALADDLDTPTALAAIDAWARGRVGVSDDAVATAGALDTADAVDDEGALVRDIAEALLGVRL